MLFEAEASDDRDVCAVIATRHALQRGGGEDARLLRRRAAVGPDANADPLRSIDDALKRLSTFRAEPLAACALHPRTPVISALAAIVGALGAVAAPMDPATEPEAGSPCLIRTVTIVPAARYQAGWVHRLLLGAQWREAWSTPIAVPVLDLDTFDGGLTPDREGGGYETLNLHFKGANGRKWVFRSVDKDPRKKLDRDTAEGWIGDIAQDLISGSHPCAAVMVGPLADTMGVHEASAQLFVMPDDPRLQEFRAIFAGRLGMFEERIEKRIPGVNKVLTTIALFERLDRRGDEHVDARDYLRARLLDILVGDWDRHNNQWWWVRIAENDQQVWRVVPRDRDYAFSRMSGALPSVFEYYAKPTIGWGDTYPPIEKITFAARYTDRRFLVPLERAEWEAVTAEAVSRITDTVIAEAVHKLPPPMYEQAGEQLERALRSRRDRLMTRRGSSTGCSRARSTCGARPPRRNSRSNV